MIVTSAEAAHGHPHGYLESLRQLHADSPSASYSARAMGLLERYSSIAYREEWERLVVTLEGADGAVLARDQGTTASAGNHAPFSARNGRPGRASRTSSSDRTGVSSPTRRGARNPKCQTTCGPTRLRVEI